MEGRLGPYSDPHQGWDRFELRVMPNGTIRSFVDAFGNIGNLITIPRAHQYVELTTHGEVDTLLVDPFAVPLQPPRPLAPAEQFDYLQPSRLVPSVPELVALAETHRGQVEEDRMGLVRALMSEVYRGFSYEQNVTSVGTTVAEVMCSRAGVCQDFSHVLIGLC